MSMSMHEFEIKQLLPIMSFCFNKMLPFPHKFATMQFINAYIYDNIQRLIEATFKKHICAPYYFHCIQQEKPKATAQTA